MMYPWYLLPMSNGEEKPQLPSDDDIRGRFERIREELRGMELPDLPADDIPRIPKREDPLEQDHAAIDAKLSHLENRVKKTKGAYQETFNKNPVKLASSAKEARCAARPILPAWRS